jgi:uncharacterized protein YgiM (DUF1202 family)
MMDFFDKYFNKDNFKKMIDWCIKNKRFFLAALLFVLLLVLLRACTGSTNRSTPVSEETTDTEETSTEESEAADFELDSDFEQDAYEAVNNLIGSYFDAYASSDIDTLETLAYPVSDNEKSYIRVFSQYIEEYENIVCYTKAGLSEDSYLVSAYFDLKFYNVETTAPGLDFFYVETAEDGSLYINNLYSSYNLSRTENDLDPSIYAVILKFEQQEDSAELRENVENAYAEAVASDVDLATMLSTTIPNAMTAWMDSLTEETETADDAEPGTEVAEDQTESEDAAADDGSQDAAGDAVADDGSQNAAGDAAADDGSQDAAGDTAADDGSQDAAGDVAADDGSQDAAGDTAADDSNQDAAAEETTPQIVKVKITAKSVNVRKEPNTSSKIIGKVKKGETFTEMDELDGWFEISYNGETGYVSADYVTEVTE